MQTRSFALLFGIVYLLIGVLGFVPGFMADPPADAKDLAVDASYGYLLGLFPVNLLHNIVHMLVGALGIMAYRSIRDARVYSQALAVVFGALTIFGLLPGLNTTFGLIPLFGHDVWLHALTALAGAYFGFVAPAATHEVTSGRTSRA